MHPFKEAIRAETRRQFFGKVATGIGGLALANLLAEDTFALPQQGDSVGGLPDLPHFAPKAKRCIYLHMMGAPPQMDLLDYKPTMKDWYDKDLPESIRQGQRLTTMTSGQSRFPIAPSVFEFSQHGQGGAWFSELLPHTASMADDIAIIRSMHTDAINHEPAITFIQTGQQISGRPCIGSWFAYGLGSMNEDLPTFVVMNAERSHPRAGVQAISAKLWSAGFLSPEYAGVGLRTGADPVLYLKDPNGVSTDVRRQMLDGLGELNRLRHEQIGDPETLARIEQYEMAFKMQSSVPEMADLSSEPDSTFERWGEEAKQAGKFQNAALMARRLVERGVRFVQIYHRGWDVHSFAPEVLPAQARDVDRAAWALIQDLKERGLFDETLVIWGGEFGRTIYSQGRLTPTDYGRDHHPRAFTIWMAGGGVKPGISYGETDDFAHDGKYDQYLNSAAQTDAFINDIWTWVQSHAPYRNATTLIITTDHGRGTQPKDAWKSHGTEINGSDQIWFAVIGPDTTPMGEIKTGGQYYQNQIARTVAAFLGVEYTGEGKAGEAIEQVIGK